MRRIVSSIFFIFMGLAATAQNISVKSFTPLVGDMTTTSQEGKRIDQNGEVAALIKVVTTETGFFFEGGTLGIVDAKQEHGEVWVWVPRGARKITIKHDRLGILRDYRYPVEIEADRTYEMVLTTAKIETIIKEEVRQQYLAFQVSPPTATLEVNDEIWELDADGNAQEYVSFGTYTYRVQAPNYHPDAGRVTVDDPDNTKIVPITLRPNFGWIQVSGTGNLQDASVYVDNAFVGKAPCKSEALKSGPHSVRIVKKMYATYSETVTVSDNQTTTVAPTLDADFAEVTLKVDADAEIWVNDELKGTRTWTGPLSKGTYKIECKQVNHEPTMTSKDITAAMAGQTITLTAPRPIYGSLMLESNPKFCKLYVDGKDMGTTPKSINEILIGPHEIRMTKEGYADHTETVTVVKGERKQVTATLRNGCEIQFTCNVAGAQLEIDGQRMASANGTYMLTYGSHNVKATAADYQEYTCTINVRESDNPSYSIQMKVISRAPEGALPGTFSVSARKKVYFAEGNLQYQATTNTWRFAEHQWDYIGSANSNISSSYNGWIDLFSWGTSGWNSGANCYQPWSTPTSANDNYPGGSYNNNLTGSYANADWGVYNAISNGGNEAGKWRTLTKDEWKYVFDERNTASGIRYARATVNGVNGVILLPDDWKATNYNLKKTNKNDASFDKNNISASSWSTSFAPFGAVFLPAAGYRNGVSVDGVGSFGYYWSASYSNSYCANSMSIYPGDLKAYNWNHRTSGLSVRLVCPAEN